VKVEVNYRIKLPNNYKVECPILYKEVLISIGGIIFPRDLIRFDILNFNIILGKNWLHDYRAHIDCKDLKVALKDEKLNKYGFIGKERKHHIYSLCHEGK